MRRWHGSCWLARNRDGAVGDELLTILFTNVEGSTTLYSAKGDTEAREILGVVDELARRQVTAHGGRTIKSLGDGLMAVFASPRRAVACALALQEAVANNAVGQPDQAVLVRAGLHTGDVSEADGDLTGEVFAAAARGAGVAG
jgi:adenylate cyclase